MCKHVVNKCNRKHRMVKTDIKRKKKNTDGKI